MYIMKIRGKVKIPDYIQIRDDAFTLLAYFRADRPDDALRKIGLQEKGEQNIFVWDQDHKLARLVNANIGLDANFASPKKDEKIKLTESQADYLIYSGNTYADFSIPWTLTTGYNLNISKVKTSKGIDSTAFAQTLSIRGSFDLTRKWRVSASTSYDFVNHEFPTAYLEIYRDLHCWELSMTWIPFGIRQSYSFSLRVKAGALQDLKLRKQQGWYQY